MKILVIKFRHIGDVLLSSPLAKNLKDACPNSTVDYLVNAESKETLTLNPYINNVLTYERKKAKSAGVFGRLRYEFALANLVRKMDYDIVINTTEGERGGYIALFSGAKTRVGVASKKGVFAKFSPYTLQYSSKQTHIVEKNLDALRAMGIESSFKRVELYFDEKDEKRVLELLGDTEKFVQFHPTSRWFFKCLSPAQNAEIVDFLDELGIAVVITAAPDTKELEMVDEILALCKSVPVNLAGKLSLKELAALSKNAKLFFGVDTAAMHIAAAQNTPCIALFGPSGAFEWGAWDNDDGISGYTAKNGVQGMGKHVVLQAAWDCVPCGKDGCEGTKKSKCLLEYPMELAKSELKMIIETLPPQLVFARNIS